MKEIEQIKAERREKKGTGVSREYRLKKKIPGIIYGEKKDPILITLDEKKLKMQVSDSGFFSRQCEIAIENENYKVLPKDIQLHPVKENILHIDFLRVGENTTVALFVPVKFVNENECEGLKQGGVLNIVRHEVEIKTLVSKIPEFLEANLSGLEIGDSIHISSINLEDGVIPTIKDRDFTIATVAPPTVMKVEEETSKESETATESPGTTTEDKELVKEDEKQQSSSNDSSEKKEN